MALDTLCFRFHNCDVYLWAFLPVSLIGAGDEYLQGLLPDRHFDVKDVLLNSLAELLALAFVGFAVGEAEIPGAGNRVTSNPGKLRPETHPVSCQKNAATAQSCPGKRVTSRPIPVVRRSAGRALETSSPLDIFPSLVRPIRQAR